MTITLVLWVFTTTVTMRVLIIDDDAELAAAMADFLELKGAQCDFAYHGAMGLSLAREVNFDVIVLDLMLPKINGFGVCQQLRAEGCHTPILMLTACDTDTEQLEGFHAGVDDYVVKPCAMPLLWARLQALYRRNNPIKESISVGDLTLYLKEHRACRAGDELKLTPTGWKILAFLAARSPNVVSRVELEDYLWPDGDVDTSNFNVQLHQLRKAVDKPYKKSLIHTLVGVGLVLRDEA
ncbi:response regulator transcription factor [Agarilytica rhodophyticola]|uniref:response regulator transcription factor n=1 Tax=Agarilytica rhodophyticola TaxID=1737490 RepID=UPI001C200974|nr:response regulator transcription factor [Agarilytica rhodophyticola]